jgi:prolipoprotein diacylglyceryl transferase
MYGLMIATGAIVGVWVAGRQWAQRGGNADDVVAIAGWAVPAGVIGARLYHVATDWQSYQDDWGAAFAVWNGGLGIPGGIVGGVMVGALVARRRGLPIPAMLDAVAPALPIAQAIGRLGNWFNQELFGRPSALPWALTISPENRPAAHALETTFHPTFLYEAFWNLALAALLLLLARRRTLVDGQLFTLYVLGYGVGRMWVESLRIDPASLVLGVRINVWVSLLAIVGSLAVFLVRRRRGQASAARDVAAVGVRTRPGRQQVDR